MNPQGPPNQNIRRVDNNMNMLNMNVDHARSYQSQPPQLSTMQPHPLHYNHPHRQASYRQPSSCELGIHSGCVLGGQQVGQSGPVYDHQGGQIYGYDCQQQQQQQQHNQGSQGFHSYVPRSNPTVQYTPNRVPSNNAPLASCGPACNGQAMGCMNTYLSSVSSDQGVGSTLGYHADATSTGVVSIHDVK